MTSLSKRYFNWMVRMIEPPGSYRRLLESLDDTPFEYTIPRDGNRYEDGIDLRYRFAYEHKLPKGIIPELDNRPCSVLEMMIALALRCEESIMADPEEGDRIGVWFWGMIDNLGIKDMDDDHFDAAEVGEAMLIFLEHRYARNGKGGLFTVNRKDVDMRQEEIWYQALWYFDELPETKKGA